MEPRYWHGEIVYVTPHRQPDHGQDCVVELKDGTAHIKRFIGFKAELAEFAQYNPAKNITLKRADIKALFAIIGRFQ